LPRNRLDRDRAGIRPGASIMCPPVYGTQLTAALSRSCVVARISPHMAEFRERCVWNACCFDRARNARKERTIAAQWVRAIARTIWTCPSAVASARGAPWAAK